MILLDLLAAFDTVDHRILTEELFQYGIRDSALALLKLYLEDRYQQIVIGNAVSGSSLLHCAVPQGSVLGPVLFLVYIQSLALLLASCGVDDHSYADDCQIYLPIANFDETKTKVVAHLSYIKT